MSGVTSDAPGSIQIADISGQPSVIFTNPLFDSVTVMLGNGAGGLAGSVGFSTGHSPQSVSVADLDNDGRLDVSCWGGILSLGSVLRDVVGVIADGARRDIAEAEEHGRPIFSRGARPRTGRRRVRQKSVGEPIVIAGVEVAGSSTIFTAACTTRSRTEGIDNGLRSSVPGFGMNTRRAGNGQ